MESTYYLNYYNNHEKKNRIYSNHEYRKFLVKNAEQLIQSNNIEYTKQSYKYEKKEIKE